KQELDRIRRNPQHSLMYISIMTPGDVMDSSKHSFTDANVTWDPAPNDCNISESSNSSDHYLPGRDQELYGESALDWYLRDVIP
ncbi:6974_t:CDS:1, partial [Funneliformis caledonium]